MSDQETRTELRFYNASQPPFSVHGLQVAPEGRFFRLPEETAANVSRGVRFKYADTAGGRVRFCTDSTRIAIRVTMFRRTALNHMPLLGSTGFDLYRTDEGHHAFLGAFRPPLDREDGYEAELTLGEGELRELTIHFPIFGSVDRLEVGVEEGCFIGPAQPYRLDQPVLFYGSSITQGACVSRPGNAYTNVISRMLNVDHVNLGFAGNAKGEPELARYIAQQSMCLFVLDYDHNAPDPEHLEKTHEPFFLTVRERWPDLPVLMTTRTDPPRSEQMAQDQKLRREVVRKTYENALKRGDRNVRFLDGGTLFEQAGQLGAWADSCTVDGTHPNDLGAACIARAYGQEIRSMLGL